MGAAHDTPRRLSLCLTRQPKRTVAVVLVSVVGAVSPSMLSPEIASASGSSGQWRQRIEVVAASGAVYGSLFNQAPGYLAAPIVAVASTSDGGGYWTVGADGGVFSYVDARFYGSAAKWHLAAPIVGMVADARTGGYWLVGADGGVFAFHAPFFGSTSRLNLTAPIVGIAATPDGRGYWLAAADGGVFGFGDAH